MIFLCKNTLFSQIVYGNYGLGGRPFSYDMNTCSILSQDYSPIPEIPAISPDEGLFYSFAYIDSTETIVIIKNDLLNIEVVTEPFQQIPINTEEGFDITQFLTIGLTTRDENILYVAGITKVYRIDIANDSATLVELPDFNGMLTGDVVYINNKLYGAGQVRIGIENYYATLEINPQNGTVTDTFIHNNFNDNVRPLQGIAGGHYGGCDPMGLYIPFSTHPDQFGNIEYFIAYLSVDGGFGNAIDSSCVVPMTQWETMRSSGSFDASSWESHRKTCEVRLDLDADNNQGRIGPHYQHYSICGATYPLTDADVAIWTIDDRAVDSLTIALTDDGGQSEGFRLLYAQNAAFSVAEQGDTLLRVSPALGSSPTYGEWNALINSLELEVDYILEAAWRTVSFDLHAGGLTADRANAFVYLRPDRQYSAGPDTALYFCGGTPYNMTQVFPDVLPGGTWEPPLWERSAGSFFFSDSTDYGTYRYVTDIGTCEPDTAFITFLPDSLQLSIWPRNNDTVYVCSGQTYTFDPEDYPGLEVYFYIDQGIPIEPLILTPPQTIMAFVDYFDPVTGQGIQSCGNLISLTVLEKDEPNISVSLDTAICPGDTLLFAGFEFSIPTTYNFTGIGNGCDTIYTLNLSNLETESIYDERTLCPGQIIDAYGMSFNLPGDYNLSLPGALCDTQVLLRLLPLEQPVLSIDTTLCNGDFLVYGGELFTMSGSYEMTLPGPVCDTLLLLDLLVEPELLIVIDTMIQLGDSVVIGNNVFTTAIDTFFFLPGQPPACDTTVKLDIELISNNQNFADRAKTQIVVQNPLARGQSFLAWTLSNTGVSPYPWQKLELYDALGRKVLEAAEQATIDLPSGVYTYRLTEATSSEPFRLANWWFGRRLLNALVLTHRTLPPASPGGKLPTRCLSLPRRWGGGEQQLFVRRARPSTLLTKTTPK
jgi:hypothetical protein